MFPRTCRQTEASFISWRQLVEFGRLKVGRKGVAGPIPSGDQGSSCMLWFLCSYIHKSS